MGQGRVLVPARAVKDLERGSQREEVLCALSYEQIDQVLTYLSTLPEERHEVVGSLAPYLDASQASLALRLSARISDRPRRDARSA